MRYNPHTRSDELDARADNIEDFFPDNIDQSYGYDQNVSHSGTTYYPRCLTCGKLWTGHDTPDNRCPFSESPWLGVECE